jgi:citronellol/citronellal dehydrogenase
MGVLDGRVALVTGASRGIGAAIARRFAAEGARVVATARTLDADTPSPYPGTLAETVDTICANAGEAVAIRADLSSADDRAGLVDAARAAYGSVDILVNNAAASWARAFSSFPAKQYDIMFQVHVRSAFELAQAFVPDMRAAGSGWVLNMTSGAARPPVGPPYAPVDPDTSTLVYATCKAALERFTVGLASELYADRIAVNALAPSGPVLTYGMNHPPVPEGREDTVEPAEATAHAALLLCSGDPGLVTGRITDTRSVTGA